MKVRHLYVDDAPPVYGLVRAFCGWRVAPRNTTYEWRRVTCQLCKGRSDGIAAKALREAEDAKKKVEQRVAVEANRP